MNDYKARQEARRARLEARAQAARQEAASRFGRADEIASFIPMGQPILVGHHSEKRARRDQDRIHQNMRKGLDAQAEATRLQQAAAAVGSGGISSEDPEAIAKLTAELEAAEARQSRMVAVNKLVRKQDRAGLRELGYSDNTIVTLLTPDFMGRVGFPSFELTNNSANIRRIKQRIADLSARPSQLEAFETIEGDGFQVYLEDERVCFAFDERQPAAVVAQLKSRGFKWSPSRTAWVRQFSNSAVYAARSLAESLSK